MNIHLYNITITTTTQPLYITHTHARAHTQ